MWNLEEAIAYFKKRGAPLDQSALISLLREAQQESGGAIPGHLLPKLAEGLDVKESYLLAVIRRIPSLKMADVHMLELCAGPNCGKHTSLATAAEAICAKAGVQLKFVPCMRLCGKGPNLKYDQKLYHQADEALLRSLLGADTKK